VDATRIGLAGFSVGGALSTVAAADPRIRDDVRLVYSFGAYYDAFGVLRAITSGQIHPEGGTRAWTPHHWTVHVFAEQIVGALPDDAERAYLTAVLAAADAERNGEAPQWPEPPSAVSPLGQMLVTLVAEGGPVDADALLAALPPAAHATFAQVSPAAHVAGLRAPLFLMHDVGDTLIPYTEAHQLVAALAPTVPRDYAEFHMFEHVYPRAPHELLGFVPELIQLHRHLNAVFLAVTE
jgi:acetyl esterase/lipase